MKQRAILVMGIEGSGTTCVAQVLHNLGVDMGDLNRKYEDKGIHEVYAKSQQVVEGWIQNRIAENKIIWGVKFPLIHQMLLGIIEGMKKLGLDDIRLIVVKRHRDCIIQSNYEKRRYAHASEPNYYEHIKQSVDKGIRERDRVAEAAGILTLFIEYDKLIDQPQKEIVRIVEFCFGQTDNHPSIEHIMVAMDSVDRTKRHWTLI